MARLLSGVLLAAAFFAIVWFANAIVLLFVALAVGALAFHEYGELMRQLGAAIPRIPTFVAVMAAIAVVPFPYVAGEAVVGIGVVAIALGAMLKLAQHRDSNEPRLKPGPSAGPGGPGRAAEGPGLSAGGVAEGPGLSPGSATEGPGLSAGGVAEGPGLSPGSATEGPGFSPGKPGLREALFGVAAGGFAVVYLGLALGSLVGVHIFGGRGAVLLLVFTIVVSDSAQYYTGRAFGRRPLAPRLSPKKTIEGAIGGFVAAPVFLYFAGPYLVPVVSPLMIAPLGVALVTCGIAGDLFESLMKRAANMKDSSALIPGHGGVLDRIDALLFATPPFYMFLRWVYTA